MTNMASLSSYLVLDNQRVTLVRYENEESPVGYEILLPIDMYGDRLGSDIEDLFGKLSMKSNITITLDNIPDLIMNKFAPLCPTYSPISLKKLSESLGDAFE